MSKTAQGRRHGVDMSTPLLPEVVPVIDANLVSFYGGGGKAVRSDSVSFVTVVGL